MKRALAVGDGFMEADRYGWQWTGTARAVAVAGRRRFALGKPGSLTTGRARNWWRHHGYVTCETSRAAAADYNDNILSFYLTLE